MTNACSDERAFSPRAATSGERGLVWGTAWCELWR